MRAWTASNDGAGYTTSPPRRWAKVYRGAPGMVSLTRQRPIGVSSASIATAFGLVVCFGVSSTGKAQAPLILDSHPTCSGCRLELTPALRLGHASDPESPRLGAVVLRSTSGLFFVAPSIDLTGVLVYDRSGRYVRRLGRAGSGPGEYRAIDRIALDRYDSLHIVDLATRSVTVLDPSGQYARTYPMPLRPAALIPLSPSAIVLAGFGSAPSTIGLPLHTLDGAGRLLRSFGEDRPVVKPGQPPEDERTIAAGHDQRFWAAAIHKYEFEEWTTSGVLLRHVSSAPSWFQSKEKREFGLWFERRPSPTVVSIREDSTGKLWILSRVADPRWQPQTTKSRRVRPAADYHDILDTMIEVIDPTLRQVLVSQRFSHYFVQVMPSGWLVEWTTDQHGLDYVQLWQVRILNHSGE